MKKPFRTPFIIFAVLTGILFAAWAGCFVVSVVMMKQWMASIMAPFNFNVGLPALISNIASYVLAAIAIVLLVLSFALIKKKPGAKATSIILSILGIAVGLYSLSASVVASTDSYLGVVNVFTNIVKLFTGESFSITLLVCASYAFAIIFLITLALTVVFGALYSKRAIADKIEAQQQIEKEEQQRQAEYEAASVPQIEEEVTLADSFETVESEPVPVFMPEPEPTPEPEPEPVEEKKEEPAPALDAQSLATLIKEIVREVVKDEMAKQPKDDRPENDNHSIVGATFGGPLIVQYFNGGMPAAAPAPAPAPVEEPAPVKETPVEEPVEEEPVVEETLAEEPVEEPVVEEPVEPVEVEEVTEEVVEATAEEPVEVEEVEEAPAEEPIVAKTPIVRIPFEERITSADRDMQDNYNEIKNEILAYGVHSRVSSAGDTFRLHRKTYIKLAIAGKSLKLYMALDPKDYEDSKMPIGDASKHGIYEEIPFVFKVKSGLSMRRCKQLIADCMGKDGLEKGEVGTVDWVKEIQAELRERAKAERAAAKQAKEAEE